VKIHSNKTNSKWTTTSGDRVDPTGSNDLKLTLLGLLLLFAVGEGYSQNITSSGKGRPNIIVILTDDQRWDAIGYSGNKIVQTPHMDKMASESMYFRNAFVTTPICAASRATVLTGLYERTHGFTFGTPPLRNPWIDISYPKLLHDAGYRTALFGKLGMNLEDRADTLIFDELYNTLPEGYFRLQGPGNSRHIHLTDLTTQKAMAFIENTPAGQPFCLSISYDAAHADDPSPQQYFWPERNDKLYVDKTIPYGELHQQKYFDKLPSFLRDSLYLGVARYKWRFDTSEKYQRMVKGYYRLISTIDDNLGILRKYLEQKGIADNTIIIFLGDNGYFLGERGLAGKWLMYENSLRVPFMIYDPLSKAAGAFDEMVLNIDVSPTILEYAGLAVPGAVQGKSLKPFANSRVTNWRTDFFCEHLFNMPYIPKSEGIRTTDWKYFRYIDHPEHEELYNLKDDPLETRNLAADPAAQKTLVKLRSTTQTYSSTLAGARIK
jgi:arylsulfatase A-like enzyme